MKVILNKKELEKLRNLNNKRFEVMIGGRGYGRTQRLIEHIVSDYIKHCFEESDEDPKELERFIIIDPFYASYSPFLSDEENIKQAKWFHKLNEELIKQMTAKGYKYCWCEEDIEFYK